MNADITNCTVITSAQIELYSSPLFASPDLFTTSAKISSKVAISTPSKSGGATRGHDLFADMEIDGG